jgi:hypothetical protein
LISLQLFLKFIGQHAARPQVVDQLEAGASSESAVCVLFGN